MSRRYYIHHLIRDILILAASILVAFLLVKIGIIESFIDLTSGSKALSSFIAGAFFTLIFTVVPAGVALVAISNSFSPVLVAFFGALGAVLVDTIIISFVRKDLVKDFDGLAKTTLRHHLIKVFHFGFLKWVAFVAGIFFIATPLPDEPGLFFIGMSKINPSYLPLVFFISHFLGILAVVSIVSAI